MRKFRVDYRGVVVICSMLDSIFFKIYIYLGILENEFGNRVFVDVNRVRIKKRLYWIRMGF